MRDLLELAAKIAKVTKRAIGWFGPFATVIIGLFLAMVSVGAGWGLALGVMGGLMVLSAMEQYADRARAGEAQAWAKRIAAMVMDDHEVTINVTHTIESLRPELDQIIRDEIARAIAGEGE